MTAQTKPQLEPTIIVIFGITGDLSHRYLLPALYHLLKNDLLHKQTEIVGISRRDISVEDLLTQVERNITAANETSNKSALEKLQQHLRIHQMDLTSPTDYDGLLKALNNIEDSYGVCMNRLYYLAIPPQVYGPIIRLMGASGLNTSCQHGNAKTRLLVEKPFGYDYTSAKALISETAKVFREEQVFRIDHYLAKETVQNILTFRFQNPIFEAVWDNDRIGGIEISASEKIGIEGRTQFYEGVGAVRDFIQSHLIQLLAIVTMDEPTVLDSEHIHAAKQAVLKQVKSVAADKLEKRAVRGQYDGYKKEVGKPDSTTETFAAVRTFIDNPRWQDVPITLWTGKALNEKKTEISVSFKNEAGKVLNCLRFRIQPNEGIELDLITKKPGFETELQLAAMDFSYHQNFNGTNQPDAYERVLVDAIKGDRTLFATSEEVLEAWRILQPVLDSWGGNTEDLLIYKPGTQGDELLQTIE